LDICKDCRSPPQRPQLSRLSEITLSDEFQLVPEQSTSALVCHHPSAKHFSV
jgi:cobalamin-dependent methionine synthase I